MQIYGGTNIHTSLVIYKCNDKNMQWANVITDWECRFYSPCHSLNNHWHLDGLDLSRNRTDITVFTTRAIPFIISTRKVIGRYAYIWGCWPWLVLLLLTWSSPHHDYDYEWRNCTSSLLSQCTHIRWLAWRFFYSASSPLHCFVIFVSRQGFTESLRNNVEEDW